MASETESRWVSTLLSLTAHEAFCTVCSAFAGRRCAKGKQIHDAEQEAWQAWVVERYGAAA